MFAKLSQVFVHSNVVFVSFKVRSESSDSLAPPVMNDLIPAKSILTMLVFPTPFPLFNFLFFFFD
jgi:hypothetical protein